MKEGIKGQAIDRYQISEKRENDIKAKPKMGPEDGSKGVCPQRNKGGGWGCSEL